MYLTIQAFEQQSFQLNRMIFKTRSYIAGYDDEGCKASCGRETVGEPKHYHFTMP